MPTLYHQQLASSKLAKPEFLTNQDLGTRIHYYTS
jgi:hypothetical protein